MTDRADSRVTIVPAGAGAGKTYRIAETLTAWLGAGTVQADRILAVTFTEAAAAELRGRLRARALEAGMTEAALGLERAYISTIHALGLRLTREHAFAAGASPAPRLIDDAEAGLLLRRAMARSPRLAAMAEGLSRFGYKYDGTHGPEDRFRARVRGVIGLLTGLGDAGSAAHLGPEAVTAMRDAYGPVAGDGAALTAALEQAAAALLAAHPHSLSDTASSKTARDAFARDHRCLRAAAEPGRLAQDWSLWEKLRNLRRSNSRDRTPDGYDALADAVIAAADRFDDHPGPRDLAAEHLLALTEGAQEVLALYAERKRALGVVDYADMIAGTERMLAADPAIAEAVLGEIDCVVVDEFQDTNPIQFALLGHLIARAPRVLLVGDSKQAIMSFQGADARLSQALADRMPEALDPLDRNWRSDPRIMAFVNDLGPGLFGDYQPLAPQRKETGVPALEALRVQVTRKMRPPKSPPQAHVAARIRSLVSEPAQVWDEAQSRLRPVRPSDIAILCRTHPQIDAYATALRALDLPVSRAETGWHAAPVTAAARAALAFAADPADTHAALCLAVLGPPAMPLQDALVAELEGRLASVSPLPALAALADHAETRPVARFVADVIAAAGLEPWALGQPEPAAARADLARLMAEADAFSAAEEETAEATGLHGRGPRAFLGWLADRAARGEDDWRPPPEAGAGLGIELVTWHAAKGREWPIVVVAGLDWEMGERPGSLRVDFPDLSDPETILAKAVLRHCPAAPVPKVRQEAFLEARRPAVLETERCLTYVALTRARDRLILEWPEATLEKDAEPDRPQTCAGLLLHEGGLEVGPDALVVGGRRHPATVVACPEILPDPEAAPRAPVEAFRPGRPRPRPQTPRTPWRQPPSSAVAQTPLAWHADAYGPPVPWAAGVEDISARGTALHLAARVFLMEKRGREGALMEATGLSTVEIAAIADQMEALLTWLRDHGCQQLMTELPLQRRHADGRETTGIADLVAETGDGLVLIDHKSPGPADPTAAAAAHAGQVMAYAQMIETTLERPVVLMGINWFGSGTLSLAEPVGAAAPPRPLATGAR